MNFYVNEFWSFSVLSYKPENNQATKYRKNYLLIILSISLAGLVACGEEKRPPTQQEYKDAMAWLMQ